MKMVMVTTLTAALLISTSAYSQGGGVASARATQAGIIGGGQSADGRNAGRAGNRAERPAPQARAQPGPNRTPRVDRPQTQVPRTQVPRTERPRTERPRTQAPRDPGVQLGRERDRRQAGVVTSQDGRRQFERDGRNGRDGDWNRNGRDGDWNRGRGPDGQWRNDGRTQRDGHWQRPRRDRDHGRPAYEARRWPHQIQPRQRYRWYGPVWINPPGFSYRPFSYGQHLPSQWYSPRYYLIDYMRYGLPMPPAGFEWVRLGRDAVLVDVFDGRIYQVVRDLFW